MADNNPKRTLQDQHATNALSYGHLGTALYGHATKRWDFSRSLASSTFPKELVENDENDAEGDSLQSQRPNAAFRFEVLEEEKKFSPDSEADRRGSPAEHRNSQEPIRGSLAAQAGLSSLTSLVDDDAQPPVLSEPALSSRGDLVAFGGAARLEEDISHDQRPKNIAAPIAAFVSGLGGSQIRLAQIERSSFISEDLQTKQELRILVPAVSEQGSSLWAGNGHPVRQVCFAATHGDQSTWLAVMTSSSTIILHPMLHDEPVLASHWQGSESDNDTEPSFVDPNPILTLPSSRTGGHAHAAVSFHPTKHQYLAIVDEHGNWSTWQLQGKRSTESRTSFQIRLLTSNKLYTWTGLKRPPEMNPYHDGWHKILWLTSKDGDVDILLVANRRNLVLYKSDGEMMAPVQLALGPMPEAQWILDIRRSSIHHGWVFVLTSTLIFWISSDNGPITLVAEGEDYTIVCSWRHFRGREDTTLSLCITETNDGIDILLWSQITSVTSSFRIAMQDENSSLRFSWQEPILCNLGDLVSSTSEGGRYSPPQSLRWLPIEARALKTTQPSGSSFHKLFALHKNATMTEVLLRPRHPSLHGDNSHTPNTLLLPRAQYSKYHSTRSSKYAEPDGLDDFIVDDLIGRYAMSRPMPQSFNRYLRGTDTGNVPTNATKLAWTDIYAQLDPPSISVPQRIDLQDHLDTILDTSSKPATTRPGRHLLSTLSMPLPSISDVESSSIQLSSLSVPDDSLRLIPCTTTHRTTMLSTYQSILPAWVTSLPPAIPDRIRVNKERLARQVAADLTLANLAVSQAPPDVPAPEPQSPSQSQTQRPSSAPPARTLADLSISALLFSPAEPSSVPTTSASTSSQPPAEHPYPPLTRLLAQYTPLKPTALLTPSPSLTAMLSHLPTSINIHPSTYSWRATEDSLAASGDAATADPRSRRRAEKARKRRERMASSSQVRVTQDVAPVIGSSQVLPPPGSQALFPSSGVQSSQAVFPSRGVTQSSGQAVQAVQSSGLPQSPMGGRSVTAGMGAGAGAKSQRAGKRKGPAGFR